MKSLPKAGNRTPLILLGITVLLVVLALVVVLTRGAGAPVDPHSPEGVVQSYVASLLAGDQEQAAALLTAQALKDCPTGANPDRADLRVALLSTKRNGAGATVLVSITETSVRGPLGLGESGYEDSFTLVPRQDSWAISSAPWPLLACSDTAVK
ncbi:hypothetical protein [Paeniglutamicibacter kerguelensis]|uniref:Na+-transporting methylmalonyl-CoA/oxaloacetate decarboxylase gamma subunit n=1 Tax=Paeniglutamicibacter kerguelensis TaxID=254788 RepID=A0ABS4X9U3_9MICC|nr:hypothetical protein [Paeniglutamicibacter kerguelensis]MBP2385076.1 Na+-transporting methylmalonyl-CoA/oxaloacetate decarboxylase gamma subunit [Paeniglutamicibacter kerguelensis]